MDTLAFVLDLIVHVDVHLRNFVAAHGVWVYALLFVVGALCGLGLMSLPLVIALLTAAAIAGNQCNYAIGRYFGPKVFRWENSRFFNRHAFDMTHEFYEKYGGVTIVAARFLPLLRSFAPFVAGVAEMQRARFTFFDVTGGVLWVASLTLAGHLFGNIPWVQQHLDKIILLLLAATVLIALVGTWRGKLAARRRLRT